MINYGHVTGTKVYMGKNFSFYGQNISSEAPIPSIFLKCFIKIKISIVINYDPRLPSIPSVVHKHAKTLLMDPEMKMTFSEGFQIGFKRYRNLKEFICRSKLYDVGQSRRNETRGATRGWKKCDRCIACSRSVNKCNFSSS